MRPHRRCHDHRGNIADRGDGALVPRSQLATRPVGQCQQQRKQRDGRRVGRRETRQRWLAGDRRQGAQSVKGTETVSKASHGFGTGKKDQTDATETEHVGYKPNSQGPRPLGPASLRASSWATRSCDSAHAASVTASSPRRNTGEGHWRAADPAGAVQELRRGQARGRRTRPLLHHRRSHDLSSSEKAPQLLMGWTKEGMAAHGTAGTGQKMVSGGGDPARGRRRECSTLRRAVRD
jgi:hypothetical protein